MSTRKTPARFIREDVFGIPTQTAFGELLGYRQSVICRFETGARPLSRNAQDRIRAAAKRRRLKWDDKWLFEVPPTEARAHAA